MRLIAAFVALAFCGSAQAASMPATPVGDFTKTMSINAHIGRTYYAYADMALTESMFTYIGIFRTRVGMSKYTDPVTESVYGSTVRLPQIYNDIGVTFTATISAFADFDFHRAFIADHSEMFDAVEGRNEPDGNPFTYNGLTGFNSITAYQNDLFNSISSLCLPVFTYALAWSTSSVIQALAPAKGNFLALHLYPYIWNALNNPWDTFTYRKGLYSALKPGAPFVITETGYYTVPSASPREGVSEAVQAKYTLNTYPAAFLAGSCSTNIYEMCDETSDPLGLDYEWHFGLFHYDGTPKPAATALRNFVALLTAGEPARTEKVRLCSTITSTGSLDYSTTTLPGSVKQLLLRKTDNSYWLLVWNDVTIWNGTTHEEIPIDPIGTTVTLADAAASITVYNPYLGTTEQTLTNTDSVTLDVLEYVKLIKVVL